MSIALTEVKRKYTDPMEVLSRQYSRDIGKTAQVRDVDTGLLPLKINGVRIGKYYPVPKVAGGITAVGNTVIVLDRLGNLYSCDSRCDIPKKLPFPELPNNIGDFLIQPGAVVDDKSFRAYSVKYLGFAKRLAVSHEFFDKQYNKSRLAVSVISIDEELLQPIDAWQTIFLGDPEPKGPNEQAGGRLAAKGPDTLYLSVGNYQISDPAVSQDVNSKMGKILEINIDSKKVRTVSSGHRNPEGLIVTSDGTLLSTEHGPAGGDELNLIVEGANYGYPIVTLGTEYGRYSWHESKFVGRHAGYQAPTFAWVPSIGVSTLLQVKGFDQRWDDDLLVASLKAQSLYRLRLDGTKVLYSEPIWIGQRIRDIVQLQDGTIVLWTDDSELQFITIDRQRLEQSKRNPGSSDTLVGGCMYCHHFGPTNAGDFAPSLSNVLGRKIGSENYRYSVALRGKDGVWTEESLRNFFSNPEEFAPGTPMPDLHLSQDQLDEVIQDLKNNTASLSKMRP